MKSTQLKRAFKYRFYPNAAQAAELSRTFGCVRKVYNLALDVRSEAWRQRRERVGYNATSAMLTAWKKTQEPAYLNDVSSVPLQQTLRHLQTAFNHYFAKRAGFPRFKSKKRSRRSAEYTRSAFRYHHGRLTLAKMAEPLDVVWSRPLPEDARPSTVTVSQDAAGRWFVSLLCEDPGVRTLPATDTAIGVDAGLDHLLTLSSGEKIANPRHERRDRARLAKAQRACSRKEKGSATVVIEDLAVQNMMKNRRVSRAISDAAWRQSRNMLEYKARWYGREVIVVDRWYPSSKLCSHCGTRRDTMPLNVRTWTCDCGTTHDRDVNAAKNLLAAGLAVSACGAGVRPQRTTPGGQPTTKQELLQREP